MNKNLKVIQINNDSIKFNDGTVLESEHEQDCCENHFLSFADLDLKDFNGLEFDLTNDNFFNRVEGYGIELLPINGYPIRVPGYGYNNGYYSGNLTLNIYNINSTYFKRYNITECQLWE